MGSRSTTRERFAPRSVSWNAVLPKPARTTDEEAAKAVKLCAELRTRMKGRHKMQRAKLWWTEGLLHARLGDERAAWWALDIARRSLIALEAAAEVGAIIGDMARISCEPPAVRHLCDEAGEVIGAPHPLADLLSALTVATRGKIPQTAEALRAAAGALAPCPAL